MPELKELLVHVEYIKEGIDALRAGQTEQNGRLRKAEQDIAVLKDRADDGKIAGRNWGAAGGFVGGFVASLVAKLGGGGQ